MSMADRGRGVDPVGERGAILPLMAFFLVVLIGVAAMAVDLGWLFWQSIEIHHGADAAALAGVVYEPDFRTEYTCSGDECWYKVRYDYAADQVHDTTTWIAYIGGNPIRIVE